MTKIVQ